MSEILKAGDTVIVIDARSISPTQKMGIKDGEIHTIAEVKEVLSGTINYVLVGVPNRSFVPNRFELYHKEEITIEFTL